MKLTIKQQQLAKENKLLPFLLDKLNELDDKLSTVEEMLDKKPNSLPITDEAKIEKIASRLAVKMATIEKGEKGDVGDDGHTPTKEELVALIRPLIPQVKDGKTPTDDELIKLIKPLLPKLDDLVAKVPTPPFLTSIEIRDRLEILGEGEKLSIQAIQDLPKILEEKLKDLEKKTGSKPTGGFNYNSMSFHIVDDETPTGTVNGVNTAFTIKDVPNPVSSLKVYVNGQRMRVTTDYTFAGVTITFVTAPPTSSIILVDYRK